MKKRVLGGIDVSAASLEVAIDRGRGEVRTVSFENDPGGHRKLLRMLTKRGSRARICLESTGVSHLELALALHATRGIEVMVANPRATKDFARAQMQRSKTDRTDARSLLEFVRRMPFEPWQPPAPEILALRALSRHMEALAGMRAQERNRAHASAQIAELTGPVQEALAEHVAFLEGTIRELQDKALALIRTSTELQSGLDPLVTVKGIAHTSAIALLAELAVLPGDMSARPWVAHAGLDPRQEQSGTSLSARVRISKVGNRHLRRALFMPAIVAVQHEPHVRAFYDKLLTRGKKPMQANVAVMRKLLHAIHGMLRNNQDFQGERFFALNT